MPTDLKRITIRTELFPGDIGTVIKLHGEVYRNEFNFEEGFEFYVARALGEMYSDDFSRHRFWIAEDDQRIVGFIALMHRSEAAQLRFFIVHRDYRGIGLGKHLFNHFLDYLHNNDYRKCYLWSTDCLPAAISLYESQGFKLVEKREDTSFGSPLVELKYELKLGNLNTR